MSLINTMLRDLDKRRAGDEARQTLPQAVRAMPDADKRGSLSVRYAVWGGVALLLAATAWWWPEQGRMPIAPKPIAAPVPVAVPPAPTMPTVAPPPFAVAPRGFQADVRAAEPVVDAKIAAKPVSPVLLPAAIAPAPAIAAVKKTEPAVVATSALGRGSPRASTSSPLRMDEHLSSSTAQPSVSDTPKLAASVALPRMPAISSIDPALANRDADDWSRAQTMLREGRNDHAEPLLQRLLQSKPGNAAARQALLGILLPARRHAEAISVLSDGLLLNPENVGWAMNLARLHADANNYAAAWKVLDYSAPNARQNPDYLAFCGTVLQRLNRNGEAITHYLSALQIKPNESRWWVGYAIALEAEGKVAEAKEALRRALALGDLPPEIARFAEQKLN